MSEILYVLQWMIFCQSVNISSRAFNMLNSKPKLLLAALFILVASYQVQLQRQPSDGLIRHIRSSTRKLDGLNERKCGIASRQSVKPDSFLRSSVGYKISLEEFPSYVHLTCRRNSTKTTISCSGIIVHKDIVLTAAHCVKGYDQCQVEAGLILRDSPAAQVRYAWGWCSMPNYRQTQTGRFQNDVALVQLRKPFEYSAEVQPACLEVKRDPDLDTFCVMAGFRQDFKNLVGLLMKRSGCSPKEQVYEAEQGGATCYSTSKHSTCAEDAGSAIYCTDRNEQKDDKQFAVGLVSYTEADCEANRSSPIMVMDFHKLSAQLESLLNNCWEYLPPGKEPKRQTLRRI